MLTTEKPVYARKNLYKYEANVTHSSQYYWKRRLVDEMERKRERERVQEDLLHTRLLVTATAQCNLLEGGAAGVAGRCDNASLWPAAASDKKRKRI
jgi:hypothetical protein